MKIKIGLKQIIFLVIFIALIILTGKVQASYKIENMDIQATIQENGSVNVKQSMTYRFNGEYNGIYIDIPEDVDDKEYDEYRVQTVLKDSLYNASKVIVNKVSEGGKTYSKTGVALNGDKEVYTEATTDGIKRIKIYSPSSDTKKTFVIEYILEDLCVKHNDIGELYYNFIGGNWQTDIEKLNIDIYLPNNQSRENLYVFGHGPYNGKSQIISESKVNFKVENVKKGQYVATRVLFPTQNIANSDKTTNLDAISLILQDENSIIENKEEKNNFTKKVIIFTIILLIYWIALLIIFERDKKYKVTNINEEELFKRYNPLLAGCIQESRTVLSRDIIAVVINLINKKVLKLELIPKASGKDNYQYILTKEAKNENKMDEIEKFVYDWVFEGKDKIDLVYRLDTLPKDKQAADKFKELNDMAQDNLKNMGANKEVPLGLKIFNTFVFIISIIIIYIHIKFNAFDIYSFTELGASVFSLNINGLLLLPMLMILLYVPIRIILMIRHGVNRITKEISGKRLVATTITILLIAIVVVVITQLIAPNSFLIIDEILFAMALIILLTDNLMLKNSPIMIEDFSKLNALKDKLENTLMDTRDVEYVVLWNEYLAYSISFGIADKIIDKLKGLYLDDDLTKLIEDNNFYGYINSDYYMFYMYASIDTRFMRGYSSALSKMMKNAGRYSSRRRWRIFWRRRLFRWWRKRPEAGGAF